MAERATVFRIFQSSNRSFWIHCSDQNLDDVPALENRLQAIVLIAGGFAMQPPLPEVDTINFITRITVPVLMLNGRYDFFFPVDASQIPMFRRLGTPTERKRHVVLDVGHMLPSTVLSKEVPDWLDRHLGPVK